MTIIGRLNRYARRTAPAGYSSARQQQAVRRILLIQHCFYVAHLFLAFFLAKELWPLVFSAGEPLPLWPVFWLNEANLRLTAAGIILFLFGGAVGAAMLVQARIFRVAVAIGVLLAAALFNSFGSISHGLHIWFWMAAMFALFPSVGEDEILSSRALRLRVISIFVATQMLVMLFYTLSGLFKLTNGFTYEPGAISSLSLHALSVHVSASLFGSQGGTILGDFIIENPWLGWPVFLAVLYFEIFAVYAVFRPSIQRMWGFFLITFHLGIFVVMGIAFLLQPVQVLLLMAWSPFAVRDTSWRQLAIDMPVIGVVARELLGPRPAAGDRQKFWAAEMQGLALLIAICAALFFGRFLYRLIF